MDNNELVKKVGIERLDLEAVTGAHRALTDALRTFNRPEVLAALGSFTRQQDALRQMLKPMEDVARMRTMLSESRVIQEIGWARLLEDFQSHYRLPAIADLGRLAAEFEASGVSKMLAQFAGERSALAHAMEQMQTPWLRLQDSMRSVSAFAELQGMGRALDSFAGFDEGLAAALRAGIGDWRDRISWEPQVLLDLDLRADFYAGLGFNHDLTALPAAAFDETLDISGMRRERPALVVLYGAPVPVSNNESEEEDLDRAAAAYDWLHRLETQLRRFIDECMTEAFGQDWPRHRLPNGMHDQWLDKRHKAEAAGAAQRPLIAYADFTDYALVMCRGDNWREVFARFFRRPENVRESFQRLYPIRLDTMHARAITQDDELLLFVEAKRLMKMMLGR